jgi:HAD superfamily hydrolase (TIGR02253 family)
MPALKAVLFDLDNTLIDFISMKRACCRAAVRAMIRSGLGMGERDALGLLFRLYDRHGIEYGLIFEEFLKEAAGGIDYRMLAEGIVAYREEQRRRMKTYPAVVPTLKALRGMGLRLGIVSDAPSVKAWTRLVELGIQGYFDAVVTFEGGEMKPSRKPFLMALEKLGAKPGEAVFVGDWPERDMEGAKRVGMRTIYARYGNVRGAEAEADFVAGSFRDIAPIIMGIASLPGS